MCLRCPVCHYITFCHNDFMDPDFWADRIVTDWSEVAASHYAPDGYYCEYVLYLERKERLP